MIAPYYDCDGITIYNCDCREVVSLMDARVVDSIVTDPPYGLEFMGKAWDHGVPGFEFWDLLKVVCKPGAMLLAFGGTRKFHRLACAIEDAGWEMRDCINWLYGSGFPKSLDISKAIDKAAGKDRTVVTGVKPGHEGFIDRTDAHAAGGRADGWDRPWRKDSSAVKASHQTFAPATDEAAQWQGWGTALKPAWEPIIVAMKPLDGTFAVNALKHGVAGLNIDECRVPLTGSNDPRLGGKGTWGTGSMAKNAFGEYEGKEVGSSEQGRFPANVIHDGSDEVLECFPNTTSKGHTPKKRGAGGLGCNGHSGQDEIVEKHHDKGSAARFFYCAKASSSERSSRPTKDQPLFGESDQGFTNTHPTVKPLALMKYLLHLVSTPTGGLVLDPFMGSGSTLVAAKSLGRKAIGIEINKEYCDIAVQRLAGN